MNQKYTIENIEDLFAFIENKQYRNLKDAISDWNEADIAELIEKVAEEYGNDKAVLLFRLLSKDVAATKATMIHVMYGLNKHTT